VSWYWRLWLVAGGKQDKQMFNLERSDCRDAKQQGHFPLPFQKGDSIMGNFMVY